jgi:opacity protein-like surface antigen
MADTTLFMASPEIPTKKTGLTDMTPMQTLSSVITSEEFLKGIYLSVSLGIYNRYSKADDGIQDLAKLRSFPPLYLRFAKELNPSMKVGLQMGFARYRFASGDFSSFEQVFTTNDVRENIVSMIAYGKYQLKGDMVKPYGMAGLGFNSSRVGTRRRIDFVDGEQGILVNSVAQSISLAIMIRGGADVQVMERLSVFGDFGLGISTFQLGTTFRLN